MQRREFFRWTVFALAGGALAACPPVSARNAADGAAAPDPWRRALAERRVVEFSYHGFPRVVEPHALGLLADGKRAVHAFQTDGGSASEPPPGWRTFVVAEMKDVKLAEKTFAKPRADYRRGALKTIEAEVAGAGDDAVAGDAKRPPETAP